MAYLGNKSINDSLLIAAQTTNTSKTPTDADSLPTYQIYEQGGTTAIASGDFGKRDDANTTGYYEASVTLSTANGYENGKQYYIRKLATVNSQAGVAVDTFAITSAGATTVSALSSWPTTTDVLTKLTAAGITLRGTADSTYRQLIINAVVAEFLQETKREYVAGSAEARYFDGSGTGIQTVDAMVSLTSVELIGYFNEGVLLTLTNVVLAESEGYPRTKLLVRQGSYPASGYWLTAFPAGRENIKVTGVYGYGSAIPQDVWEAVCGESAERLAMETMFSQGGRLESWKEADTSEQYKILDEATGQYWHKNFLKTIQRRKRPLQEVLKSIRAPMI